MICLYIHEINSVIIKFEEGCKLVQTTNNLPCPMNLTEFQTLPSSPKSALFNHYVILKFSLFATRFISVVIYKTLLPQKCVMENCFGYTSRICPFSEFNLAIALLICCIDQFLSVKLGQFRVFLMIVEFRHRTQDKLKSSHVLKKSL